MGILLCEHNFRNVWIRNESVRAEIGQIVHTDTHPHTTAAKLVVRITLARKQPESNIASVATPRLDAQFAWCCAMPPQFQKAIQANVSVVVIHGSPVAAHHSVTRITHYRSSSTRWLPGFARVPNYAPSPCHMHPVYIISIT